MFFVENIIFAGILALFCKKSSYNWRKEGLPESTVIGQVHP